ncbi:hypothetical protein PAXINDRAFT_104016 [Paxillus involutus ATCC 200175]|uniref:Uncharacterized protein n=2 Tax=Paxillus involutus ATCC 200175 TaxID=664439 RepID=A0A0C9TBZ9_PAXIN|nr:hypothetical protein PAXINDRAFT_104016 [Paxillus involutus ATCC 200175]
MEYDRKSAVSSFYGARRSIDVLNDVPEPPPVPGSQYPRGAARPRAESQSSFYADRQSRASHDLLNGQSAGYNASSFFDAGRQEPLKGGRDEEEEAPGPPEAWDVFADFNNMGPRYSSAFGVAQHQDSVYHQIPAGTPNVAGNGETDNDSSLAPVELVTVPALGPEWQRAEMKQMTRSGRRELKNEERYAKWRAWNRGETGLCGTKWFTKKFLVFFIFAWCGIAAIILAITIPRVPALSFNSGTPLVAATGDFNASIPTEFSRYPANFSFPAFADIQVDTTSNIIPLTFNHIAAQVWYPSTNMQIGTGYFGKATLPAKTFPVIQIPLNFSYIAPNDTDPTWLAWYNACKNPQTYTTGVRPGVSFELLLTMDIAGLPTTSTASTQIGSAPCPIELPVNSV